MSGIRGIEYTDENGNLVLTGGRKAAETNKKKFGKDFYRIIGAKGGRNGHDKGFHNNPELAKKAGRIGGYRSKRGPSKDRAIRVQQAHDMYVQGINVETIAETMNRNVITIKQYLKEWEKEHNE